MITYTANITPIITSISPEYGDAFNWTVLKIDGSFFSSNILIKIDDITCEVLNATLTTIFCNATQRGHYKK